MEPGERVDWDFFWIRVKKHPVFLKFLYSVHLRKYKKVMNNATLKNPNVVELGAGTGAAALRVQELFGGKVTLVDNNAIAYEMHRKLYRAKKSGVRYLRADFNTIECRAVYDLVMSDGLLEHFSKKEDMIKLHKSFAKKNGYILIFALNQNLFTKFLELGEKKMGYSDPVSMDDCIRMCQKSGLKVVGTINYFFEYGVLCKKEDENG